MNEADTRAELIDKQLQAAGWRTDSATSVRVWREYGISADEIKISGARTPQLKADYVLEYRHVKLAVVEAKSNQVEVSEGVAQAKRYAQKLQLPFSFAANGKAIYQIDHTNSVEGEIAAFPSPEALWRRVFVTTNPWLECFRATSLAKRDGKPLRYYQELAINRTMEAIANGQQRVLLTLATGTGKTWIAFQIAWKLFHSRWTQQQDQKRRPRILFLTDRNILADQAFNGFSAFADDALVRIKPNAIARCGEVPKNGSVFFTIFQTFMSGKDGKPYFGEYAPDFFDLVIIDECHRGGANDESTWRNILNHFSKAVHLGLTATPKRCDNVDTYAYFDEPVFTYSLKEGIQDGFLTPFKVQRTQTTIDEYLYTPDDEVLEGEVDSSRVYRENDFNQRISIEARERKRVQCMLATINASEKTIVFCANQAHAAMVRDLINQETDHANVDYCVRVTANDGITGEHHLQQFQDNEKSIPTILTTSHKLSTGVDASNVRNIVLMRPINSMIEFKQIIGRGTRLFAGKYFFTIMDFVNAYHLFNDPQWDGDPAELVGDGDKTGTDNGNMVHESGNKNRYNTANKEARKTIRIKLSDGKVRELQSMTSVYFYADGKPLSAKEFLERLFNIIKLPDLLGSPAELRRLWADPRTRSKLLKRLACAGCSKADLHELQTLINAENSDLLDVLEYIAYTAKPISRAERVANNRDCIFQGLDTQQHDFAQYVLDNYVRMGVDELDISRLSTILSAKYGSTQEAQQELGSAPDIQRVFIGLQALLYRQVCYHHSNLRKL